jgi:RNA polymerase sigma factor (sigma-70 family)
LLVKWSFFCCELKNPCFFGTVSCNKSTQSVKYMKIFGLILFLLIICFYSILQMPDFDKSLAATNNRDNVEQAFKILHEHGDYIRRVIISRVKNKDLSNEIFQDFFLSLASRPLPSNVTYIRSYLYKAVNNDIGDAIRRLDDYKERMQKYIEALEPAITDSSPVKTLIEEEQRREMIAFIMKQLPDSCSQAIIYRYGENQSLQEVAKTMGVKTTSVSRYISTGLEKIRQILSTL